MVQWKSCDKVSSSCARCLFYLPSLAIWLCFPPPWLAKEQAFALWVGWHLQDRKRIIKIPLGSHSAWNKTENDVFALKLYAKKAQKTLFNITTEITNLKTWDKSINRSGIRSIWQQLGLEGWGRDRKRQCCCDRRWQAGHLCNCDPGWYCGGTFSLGAIRANNKRPPLSPAGVCQEVWLVQRLFSKSTEHKSITAQPNWPAVLQTKRTSQDYVKTKERLPDDWVSLFY